MDLLKRARTLLRVRSGPLWSSPSEDGPSRVGGRWQNWAGNQSATPTSSPPDPPTTENEVIAAVNKARNAGKKVRVLGSGYSFSPLVPTDDCMLDISKMDGCHIDETSKTVTAEPGITISQLHRALMQKKLCLKTAPVIPWVTVGGALGTGVHGTGGKCGTLADLILKARVVDASGTLREVDGPLSGNVKDDGRALGCNLGAIGVVTSVTFQAVDLFNLEAKEDTRNYWLQDTMLSRDGLSRLLQEAPYVSALWWPGTERCWVKKWNYTTTEPTTSKVQYLLEQLGIWIGTAPVTEIGKLLARHPEWTPIFTSMVFDQIRHQTYVSPAPDVFHFLSQYPKVWDMQFAFDVDDYSHAGIDGVVNAWKALVKILEEYRSKGLFPQNMAAHMRHIRSSVSLLSPSTGHKGSVALEIVTLHGQQQGLWANFFAEVETAWLGLEGRPHWGKLHSWGDAGGEPHNATKLKEILKKYPPENLAAFRQVRQNWDPNFLFQNPYTEALDL